MPSLSDLGQFKSSFDNIGNEKENVLALNGVFDDLPLPKKEATPMDFSRQSSSAPSPLEDDSSSADTGAGDFDFGAFLNTLPADIQPPPEDDFSLPDVSPSPVDEAPADETVDNLEAPTDNAADLSALDMDIAAPAPEDASPADIQTPPEQTETADAGDFDLSSLGLDDNLGASAAEAPSAEKTDDDESLGAIDLGGESQESEVSEDSGKFAAAETPTQADTFDMPEMDIPQADTPPEAPEEEALDLDSFAEPAAAPGTPPDDAGTADDEGSIDLGGESPEISAEESASSDDGHFSLDNILPDIDGSSDADTGSDFDSALPDMDFDSGESPGVDEGAPPADMNAVFDDPLPDMDFGGTDDTPPPMDTGSDFDSTIPDMDFGAGETPSVDEGAPPADMGSVFDDPLPDMDFGSTDDTPPPMDAGPGFDSPLPDMDFSGMGEPAEDSGTPGAGMGDFGSDFANDSIELENNAEDHPAAIGSDDFDLAGLDDLLDKSKSSVIQAPKEKKSFFSRKKKVKEADIQAHDDVEEIQLDQDDVDNLLKTLASYPLNLRIVCQELIAEQVILPQQLSKLIHFLVNGASIRETAALAKEITGKEIVIPKSFEKMTGAAFEAEQSSFAYIFVHNFLPLFRFIAIALALLLSILYLGHRFIYEPIQAENLYKRGYERIFAGEYQRANELFHDASTKHRKKNWFYRYAEGFRDQRRYMLAEAKYDELLRYYPRDKKGVLDYAALNTYYLFNYDKANKLLQEQLLDYNTNDVQGLIAAGDNFMAWADSDPSRFYDKYEDARFSYARTLDIQGWQPPVVERMLKYFIRTDNLKEVLHLRVWFENNKKANLSPASRAELGGYLLDKQLETVKGVPDPYLESIESVRAMLLSAALEEPLLPEPHYHLARYHNNLGNVHEERLTLENAIRAFDLAPVESVRRRLFRVDTHYRYANLLINAKEFFPAEESVVKGIELYEDFLTRNLIRATPELGRLYAQLGDLEFFVKAGDRELGNTEAALRNYHIAERYQYSPPDIQYRMGAAYYHQENWRTALEYLFRASSELPLNRRMLYALGNAAYQRGDYFAAQGYYDRLLDVLENQRIRLPVLLPNDSQEFIELGERLMMARNNAGVVYEALAQQTGNRDYRSKALALYAESARAWDSITRNPETMVRMRLSESSGTPGINLGYLNANNAMRPVPAYNPQIFTRIDKDVQEPSRWEQLSPVGGLHP